MVVTLVLLTGLVNAATRTKELGVVDYFKSYKGRQSERSGKKIVKLFLAQLKALDLKPEMVDVDIFLPERKAERDQYKRIAITCHTDWFSKKLYEGMNDYVKSGGLLVTNSSLVLEDKDGDYQIEDGEGITKYPAQTFLGAEGTQSVYMTKIRAPKESPLTEGLKAGEWIDLKSKMAGRLVRKATAEIIIESDTIYRGKPHRDQPFLMFKHQDKGACIYLVGQVSRTDDPTVLQILRNIFSDKTLDWLCMQE
jgi:hypothetical protein